MRFSLSQQRHIEERVRQRDEHGWSFGVIGIDERWLPVVYHPESEGTPGVASGGIYSVAFNGDITPVRGEVRDWNESLLSTIEPEPMRRLIEQNTY